MGTAILLFGLKNKRARMAGEIEAEERHQAKRREALETLDAVIRMFEPQGDPELIAPIRPYSVSNLYFKRGEQMRLCVAALREAKGPMSCRQVVNFCLSAKGLSGIDSKVRAQITEHVRAALVRLAERGVVRKIVERPETWWELLGD